jgi:hypothetical protein
MKQVVESVIKTLLQEYGEEWLSDGDANERFVAESHIVLSDVDGAHLIGDPSVEDGRVKINIWVDEPLADILAADQLAFDLFSRISEELFYTERVIDQKTVNYPFVTGSARHGHAGAIVLSGPHAADFAQRFQVRTTGSTRFHA